MTNYYEEYDVSSDDSDEEYNVVYDSLEEKDEDGNDTIVENDEQEFEKIQRAKASIKNAVEGTSRPFSSEKSSPSSDSIVSSVPANFKFRHTTKKSVAESSIYDHRRKEVHENRIEDSNRQQEEEQRQLQRKMVGTTLSSKIPDFRIQNAAAVKLDENSKAKRRLSVPNIQNNTEFQHKNHAQTTRKLSSALTITREPFYSSSTFLEVLMREFWLKLMRFQHSMVESLSQQRVLPDDVKTWGAFFGKLWRKNEKESCRAFDCLLRLLEICLNTNKTPNRHFRALAAALDKDLVPFLAQALPALIDSDNVHGTDYVDLLLLFLTTHYICTGVNVTAEFFKTVPYLGGFYMRQHEKTFQELYCYIYSNSMKVYDETTKSTRLHMTPHYLSCLHLPPRKIIVSNAPPVKLKRRPLYTKNKFECEVAAGGLVAGIKPCLERTDVWVSYFDSNILDFDKVPDHLVPKLLKQNVHVRTKFRRNPSMVRLTPDKTSLQSGGLKPHDFKETFLYEKAEQDFLSLQTKLDRFAEQNFVVNPLIIMKEEHKAFYNGISNGLFWPAFHNLPQYIIKEYTGEAGKNRLAEDWCHYIKVNHHFAIHAARSCRQHDFLWIHDYHLFLVGGMFRALDPTLDCGFFLHIPFGLSRQFLDDYPDQCMAVLRGLLGFTRVGFQTNQDTNQFIRLIEENFPEAKITPRYVGKTRRVVFTIMYNNFLTDVGTFSIGIKTTSILNIMSAPDVQRIVEENRSKIMQSRQGKLFLSVERFDYSKGILERFRAIKRYFEKYPKRASLDVFYQIASSSRSDVSSYKTYQEEASKLSEEINALVQKLTGDQHAKAIILDSANHPQEEVFHLYKTADVIVVTPMLDGMNLVIKEAVICNPEAAFVLSTGAGAERQFHDDGLSHCYIRLTDVNNVDQFADGIYKAVNMNASDRISRGRVLFDYTRKFDIDYWITSFIDPSWTQAVVQAPDILNLDDLSHAFDHLQRLRRSCVKNFLENVHVGITAQMSFTNLLQSFVKASKEIVHQCPCELTTFDHQRLHLDREIGFINQDLLFLDFESHRRPLLDFLNSFRSMEERIFVTDYEALNDFILDSQPADIIVFRWEDLLVPRALFDFTTGQSLAAGLLLTRFCDRFAEYSIIRSELPVEELVRESVCLHNVAILSTSDDQDIRFDNTIIQIDKSESYRKLERIYFNISKYLQNQLAADHFSVHFRQSRMQPGAAKNFENKLIEIRFDNKRTSDELILIMWRQIRSIVDKIDPDGQDIYFEGRGSCSARLRIRRKNYTAKTITTSKEKAPTKNEPEQTIVKIGLEHLFETLAKKLSRFPSKFDSKSKIVVFDVHGHEEEWDEWASSRGIKIHAAFLETYDDQPSQEVSPTYASFAKHLRFQCSTSLLAAMAKLVLKPVCANI